MFDCKFCGYFYFPEKKFREGTAIKKLTSHSVPDEILKFSLREIQKIKNGEIIFVAQDGYLMQVEVNQKIRVADWEEKNSGIDEEIFSALAKKILSEFEKLSYGRLVVKIQKGRVTQIERTVQSRFTGLDGEGI